MSARGLAGLLEASARLRPDNPAVVDEGGKVLTYAQLDRWAEGIAEALCEAGITAGDRVGIAMPKTLAAVAAIFGSLKAGAAYVPVDVEGPVSRARAILEDCAVTAVVVDAEHLSIVPLGVSPRAVLRWSARPHIARAETDVWIDRLVDGPRGPSSVEVDIAHSDLAYVLYTSGSTGTPKGAMISHGNVLAFLGWCSSTFAPTEADRFSNAPPLHFDPSVLDLFLAMKHGASVHLMSPALLKAPVAAARFIADHRLTVWNSTPSTLLLLLRFANLEEHDASSLRLVMFGGEVFPVKPLRQLRQLWPGPDFYNLYGPTETTVACTASRVPAFIPEARERPYPIGFPCSHCEAVVLGADGDLVPEGAVGMLHVHGPSIFGGYWGRGDQSAAAFADFDGRQWYCTGDLVRYDASEGYSYLGRRDRMVKRRGHRIELDEIELALSSHADIREAAAVAIPGDGGVRILAFVVFEDGRRPTAVELKEYCAQRLPVSMSPDRFVEQSSLPRTSTGKVAYQQLVDDTGGFRAAS